jgi:two-component system, OmpR family, alkaline phosphatase synthesis response regulator PhoP
MQPTILMIDDDIDMLDFMEYNLGKAGYKVILLNGVSKAVEIANKEKPDLIILDIKMPDGDGISLCEELRKSPLLENTIIIFLTAASEDYTQIASFEVGADDYLIKPVKPKVLLARIQAILKRRGTKWITQKVTAPSNALKVNQDRRTVTLKHRDHQLPKKAFDIVNLLASNPGKVYRREEIYSSVWNRQLRKADRSLDVHIRQIRKLLGNNYIITVKGIGFRLEI